MNGLVALLVPMVPGIVWMFVFYRTDRFQPEPKGLVVQTFVLGIASVVPTTMLYEATESLFPTHAILAASMQHAISPDKLLIACFFVIGPIEELCKFFAVRIWAYRQPPFDEPPDGIVYAAAAALGFAAFENIQYVTTGQTIQLPVLILRSVTSVPAHVMFACLWGAALSYSRFATRGLGLLAQIAGLIAASMAHGLYDYFAFNAEVRWALVPLMVMMSYMTWVLIRLLRSASQFAPERIAQQSEVGAPAVQPAYAAAAPVAYPLWLPGGYAPAATAPRCVKCGARGATHSDRFCGHCGATFTRPA